MAYTYRMMAWQMAGIGNGRNSRRAKNLQTSSQISDFADAGSVEWVKYTPK